MGRQVFPVPGFGPLEECEFPYEHKGPPERVIIDRVLSVSFMAALDKHEQEAVAAKMRALIAETPDLAGRAEISFPYKTLAVRVRKAD